jgi:uncharacterized OB-fold protein
MRFFVIIIAMQAFVEPSLLHPPHPGDMVAGTTLRLAASACPVCERVDFPRRVACAQCLGSVGTVALGPSGVLRGFTAVLHQPPDAQMQAPYWVGDVEFAEGVSVVGLLVDVDGEPAKGSAVEVVAVPLDNGTLTFGYRVAAGA